MSREIFDLPPYSEIWKDTKKRTPLSKERELLREIMGYIASGVVSITSNDLGDAAETLHEIQELLAQPEQEPVAWIATGIGGGTAVGWYEKDIVNLPKGTKLYLHSPKRKPLSEDKLDVLAEANITDEGIAGYYLGFRDAEKHHGIGGGE